jgi:acetyl/propionyl-CoA carboxylase alpha subunit
MGDKAVARATVSRAGVQVVPGTEGEGSLGDENCCRWQPQSDFHC